MVEKINAGGHVFPSEIGTISKGITLRDYFAAKAMQRMLACETPRVTEQEFAERAYKMADAMLKARGD